LITLLTTEGSLNKHKGTLSKPTEGTNTTLEGTSNIPSPNRATTSNLYSIYSIVRQYIGGTSTLTLQVYSTLYSAIQTLRRRFAKGKGNTS
jgi:hypothetical protein